MFLQFWKKNTDSKTLTVPSAIDQNHSQIYVYDHVSKDEEMARQLQAEFDNEIIPTALPVATNQANVALNTINDAGSSNSSNKVTYNSSSTTNSTWGGYFNSKTSTVKNPTASDDKISNPTTIPVAISHEITTSSSSNNYKMSTDNFSSTVSSMWGNYFNSNSKKSDDTDLNSTEELPLKFRDCKTHGEKWRWIKSERGQAVLSKRPVLNEFYQNGKLEKILRNSHWTTRLNDWLDDNQRDIIVDPKAANVPFQDRVKSLHLKSGQQHVPPHIQFANNPYFQMSSRDLFPISAKYDLLTDGYTVIRQIIPEETLNAACKYVDLNLILPVLNMKKGEELPEHLKPLREDDPSFTSVISDDPIILGLFYASPLNHLLRSLLYGDNSEASKMMHPNLSHGGQIAIRYTDVRPNHQWMSRQNGKLGGLHWHIDGMDKGTYSPFALLVGVALNDQNEEYSGNLYLHPGSHYQLQSYVKNFAMKVIENEKNGLPLMDPETNHRFVRMNKPDLGEPVQMKVSRGDVIIVHQRVGHRGGPNYSNRIRKMIYFRVSHAKHNLLKLEGLDDPWIQCEGMKEVLEEKR